MSIAIVIYFLIQLVVFSLVIVLWLLFDKRYKHNHGVYVPDGFEPTNEVMLDPKDLIKYRVYFNQKTGERFYLKEN